MLSVQDHAVRAVHVGASEVSALLGAHPHLSSLDVWQRLVHNKESESNEQMAIGNALEPGVVSLYLRRHKLWTLDAAPSPTLTSANWPYLCATPDRLIHKVAANETWLLEAKTHAYWNADAEWGEEGSGDIPAHHSCQVQMTLAITGLKRADVAVLFNGRDFRVYTVEANPTYQKALHEVVVDFWKNNVEKQIEPPPDGHEKYTAHLKAKYPAALNSSLVDATDEQAQWMEAYDDARGRVKHWEGIKSQAWQWLTSSIGVASGLVGPWGKATWTNNQDGLTTDWEAACREAGVPEELVLKHTVAKPGARVLRVTKAKAKRVAA